MSTIAALTPAHSRTRSVAPLLLALVVAGSVAWAFYGERGVLANQQLALAIAAREEAIDRREQTIAELRREVERMETDPALQERWVRQELGYVRPGEVLYLFPGDRAQDLVLLGDRQLVETPVNVPGARAP